MYRKSLHVARKVLSSRSGSQRYLSHKVHRNDKLLLSEEIQSALHEGKPVVALETTIVTHGMPQPQNLSTALEVEALVRQAGAVPATIGILKGNIHVGLNEFQLEYLADSTTKSVKTSRRDLPFVLSQGLDGGTTVSGTMIAAHMAGIPVFVTGGIGGVHRGAETSMDISADLIELGQTPVAVVSSGVKSILDIGLTLEYLETQGVCVTTYGPSCQFPAFFSRDSGFKSPYSVSTAVQAAEMIYNQKGLGLQTGMLFAVPIPEEFDTLGQEIESVIQSVVIEAREKRIHGKEVTPYILGRVNELTEGKSLEANIGLIKNNAVTGSHIAVELSNLERKRGSGDTPSSVRSVGMPPNVGSAPKTAKSTVPSTSPGKEVVVVGGTIVDFYAQMMKPDFETNGATYPGSVRQSLGGVGRNLADALSRLGMNTKFISAVGDDSHTAAFEANSEHMDLSGVVRLSDERTATYCAFLTSSGELLFGIGDMDIHDRITPDLVSRFESDLASAQFVCVDGNIPKDTIEYVCTVCKQHSIPVLFEPTDVHKASKPFLTSAYKGLTYTSPNINELRAMAAFLTNTQISTSVSSDAMDLNALLHECINHLKTVANVMPVTIVTLGCHGVLLCRHGDQNQKLPIRGTQVEVSQITHHVGSMFARHQNIVLMCEQLEPTVCAKWTGNGLIMEHFPACPLDRRPSSVVSVSGAGDCLISGLICGALQGLDPSICVRMGLHGAQLSLQDPEAVPGTLSSQCVTGNQIDLHMNIQSTVLRNGDGEKQTTLS